MTDTRTILGDIFCPGLLLTCLAIQILASPALAGPVAVETKTLSSPAADPFVGFVAVGPKHEFEPVYRVLEPGACSILAYRVLILGYANYDNIVIEELEFAGSKCQDIKVQNSLSVNGVTLGYALGEGTRFAWNIEFLVWEEWNTFVIRSAKRDFRIRLNRDGEMTAEPVKNKDAERPSTGLGTGSTQDAE
ncbi:MAG: hypothetical protein RRA15_09010 [bacterium]|nr:hypothetical protein [bacterium]MDT8366621.1 hypothetical protein [bacterium]